MYKPINKKKTIPISRITCTVPFNAKFVHHLGNTSISSYFCKLLIYFQFCFHQKCAYYFTPDTIHAKQLLFKETTYFPFNLYNTMSQTSFLNYCLFYKILWFITCLFWMQNCCFYYFTLNAIFHFWLSPHLL